MTNSTRVVLVRHAETEMITKKRIHGHSDSPLSMQGIQEAQKTADHLIGQHFDAFYCSSIGRAVRTAEIIGSSINMTPIPTDGLKERHYGWLEGKPLALFEPDLTGPKIMHPIIELALKLTGESSQEFIDRVTSSFNQIVEKHQGQRVLIVLHWGILSILTQFLQGKDLSVWRGIGPWTSCGISEYQKNKTHWHPLYMDKSDHLI